MYLQKVTSLNINSNHEKIIDVQRASAYLAQQAKVQLLAATQLAAGLLLGHLRHVA